MKGVESVHKSIQRANGIKLDGAIQKPWHFSVNGVDIPLNPINTL